jgi:DNA integrity scanning protein DisA with diadenylate cyclase activity
MKTKNEYIEILASELRQLSAQIDELTAKADNAAALVKLNYAEDLEALRAQQHAAEVKMQELEAHRGEAWEALKETADLVWHDLRTGLASAVSKVK